MQRLIPARKVLSETKYSLRRCFSQLAQKEPSSNNDDAAFPKMPSFDYSPPPYNGPSAAEIISKRKEYLSPSIFHFYNKPVSFILLYVFFEGFILIKFFR